MWGRLGDALVLGVASVLLTACAQLNTMAGQVADAAARPDAVTGQRQLNLMSSAEEAELGRKFEQEILADARARGLAVDADAAVRERCQSIMRRLVGVSHRPDVPVTVHLIEDPAWNASATVGGYVFVNRGLFTSPPGIQDDDELAAVLGHEWGHVTAGHISEAVSRGLVDHRMQKSSVYSAAYRFARGQEDEADKLGVLYAALAGYDPKAASRIWTRMLRLAGPQAPYAMQVHPLTQDRVSSTSSYGERASQYCVKGKVNPHAKERLAENALVPQQAASEGVVALLEAALSYYAEGEAAKAEQRRRRTLIAAKRSQEEAVPGYAVAVQAHMAGDLGTAARGYLAVLQSNQEHSLAAYNLACIAALSGERESALQLLQLAVANGFNDAAYIQRDGDFASLRRDPRFRGIVDQASRMR